MWDGGDLSRASPDARHATRDHPTETRTGPPSWLVPAHPAPLAVRRLYAAAVSSSSWPRDSRERQQTAEGWDSNPRRTCALSGFRDRRIGRSPIRPERRSPEVPDGPRSAQRPFELVVAARQERGMRSSQPASKSRRHSYIEPATPFSSGASSRNPRVVLGASSIRP